MISRDYGETWSEPIRADDNTSPVRTFQPWVAVDKYGRVHVVWTDTRHSGKNAIYYANTLTKEFGESVEITDERGNLRSFYGDYKGITIQGDDVLFAWTDSRHGDNDVFFSRGVGLASAPSNIHSKPQCKRELKTRFSEAFLYNLKGKRLRPVKSINPRSLSSGMYIMKSKDGTSKLIHSKRLFK